MVCSIFNCVSICGSGDQCPTRHIHHLKTDLEDVAQNAHRSKGLRDLVCVLRTLCDTGPYWTILKVFDSVHLKLDSSEKQQRTSERYKHSEYQTHSQNDSIL
jgi:hypothetical protein